MVTLVIYIYWYSVDYSEYFDFFHCLIIPFLTHVFYIHDCVFNSIYYSPFYYLYFTCNFIFESLSDPFRSLVLHVFLRFSIYMDTDLFSKQEWGNTCMTLCVCACLCVCLYIKWSFPIKKILNMYALAPHGFIPNHTCSPFRFFSHAKCLIKMVRVVRKWVGDVAAWNMICCPKTFFLFYIMSLCAPSSLDFSLLSDQKTLITLHKAM